jgi:uncharacterized protein YdeI (YjbR/CyaY-like superfamily)
MGKKNADIDSYIARSAAFAQPILKKLRALYHKACPQIEETIKWGFPHFEYKGVVGSMAAFKQHAGFGFWKGGLMRDPEGLFKAVRSMTMSACKITDVSELPPDRVLVAYIKEAVALNEQGVKLPKPKRTGKKKPVVVPDYFRAALERNKKALATFEAFSPSHQREYVEWVMEAKQEATRERRLATTLEWLAEGKSRNWKYERKKKSS